MKAKGDKDGFDNALILLKLWTHPRVWAGEKYRVERMVNIENSDTGEYRFYGCVTPKHSFGQP